MALCRPCHRCYDQTGPRQAARKSREAVARPRDHAGRFVAILLAIAACLAVLTARPAQASTLTPGDLALNWAEANATGHWYGYGGAGPGAYDCSGLVMAAFSHGAGISLPHSTYAMLASPRLHRIPVAGAPRGALLFFGSGHVELNTIWPHTSFGAHHSGTTVGWRAWWPGSYEPTMAFAVW